MRAGRPNIDDHIAVAFRDDLANFVLYRLEYLRRRFNARSGQSVHVQLDWSALIAEKKLRPTKVNSTPPRIRISPAATGTAIYPLYQSSEQIGVAGAKML